MNTNKLLFDNQRQTLSFVPTALYRNLHKEQIVLWNKESYVKRIETNFNSEQKEKFRSGSLKVEIGIDHKEYSHTTKLTDLTQKSLFPICMDL